MGFHLFMTNHYNAVLGAQVLETILCCIYTLLCGYTVWRLLLRKSRFAYIFCLVTLWFLTICTLGLDWYRRPIWSKNPQGVFILSTGSDSQFDDSIWTAVGNILSILVMLIADALLVYRCYIVCGAKKWILIGFGFFLFANIVGACVEFIPFANQFYPHARARHYNLSYYVLGLFLSSILITGIATSLIILRILSATRGNPSIGNLAPYRRIQRIMVESGIIYLLCLLSTGVPLALARYSANKTSRTIGPTMWICAVAFSYSQALLIPLAGISPTLIALRVATQKVPTEDDESQPVSRLTFRRTVRRQYTPAFGSLVSSLHFESTWEDENVENGTSCIVDDEEVGNVEGSNSEEGEQIQLQEA